MVFCAYFRRMVIGVGGCNAGHLTLAAVSPKMAVGAAGGPALLLWVYLLVHISTGYGRMRLEIYKKDGIIKGLWGGPKHTPKGKRNEVMEFSRKSRERLAFVANNTQAEFVVMVTLTYPLHFPSDGAEVKSHLNRFLTWCRRNGIVDYLWFIEFQRRGAPHFHVLVDGYLNKTAVAEEWFAIVGSGDSRHLAAGTRVEWLRSKDGGARYAAKYAYKMEQKTVPSDYRNVGRFWGHSKGARPVMIGEIELNAETIEDVREHAGGLYKHVFGAASMLKCDQLGEVNPRNVTELSPM